jgi:hypothetical protein
MPKKKTPANQPPQYGQLPLQPLKVATMSAAQFKDFKENFGTPYTYGPFVLIVMVTDFATFSTTDMNMQVSLATTDLKKIVPHLDALLPLYAYLEPAVGLSAQITLASLVEFIDRLAMDDDDDFDDYDDFMAAEGDLMMDEMSKEDALFNEIIERGLIDEVVDKISTLIKNNGGVANLPSILQELENNEPSNVVDFRRASNTLPKSKKPHTDD